MHQPKYEAMVRTYRIDLQLQKFEAFQNALCLIEELGKKKQIFLPCWVASRHASTEDSRHFYPALTISFFLPELEAHQIYPSEAHVLDWLTKLGYFLQIHRIAVKRPNPDFYLIVPHTNNTLGFRVGYDDERDLSTVEAQHIAQKEGNPTYNPYGFEKFILGFPNGLLKKSALTSKALQIHDHIEQSTIYLARNQLIKLRTCSSDTGRGADLELSPTLLQLHRSTDRSCSASISPVEADYLTYEMVVSRP